jgi:hypothetical protein
MARHRRFEDLSGYGGGQVDVDAEQLRRRQHAHLLRDERPPITALRHVLRVPEALHQHAPGARDADAVPAGGGRFAGVSVAGHRRDHQVKGIRCTPAMCGGIGQWLDQLQLLDDRAGPPMRDDQWQCLLMLRTHVDEVNVEVVDLGDELRVRAQLRLDLAPVVFRRPVARELLDRRELHALRWIRDRFALGPARGVDALA